MLAKDIKTGSIIEYLGAPYIIETMSVQSPSARGGATLYKMRGRNLVTKQKADITLKGTDFLPEADFERRDVKLMYTDDAQAHFLDQEDFNQYSINKENAEEQLQYVTEELEGVRAMIYNEECVAIEIPPTVSLKVVQCDPGVKGNSATSRTKPAELETGLTVFVPEYLKEGEVIKVDTRTGDFLSRA